MLTAPIIDASTERWQVIPSYPAYSASSLGRIRRDAIIHGGGGSVRRPKGVLTPRPLPLGHLQITLCVNNTPIDALVHRLVAEAFLPPPPKGKDCVCHRDDNPGNNKPENLFWGDRRDNSDDMVRKNRQAKGEKVAAAKLTECDVREIRRLCEGGAVQREVASQFGVAQSNIAMIVQRRTWRHI